MQNMICKYAIFDFRKENYFLRAKFSRPREFHSFFVENFEDVHINGTARVHENDIKLLLTVRVFVSDSKLGTTFAYI